VARELTARLTAGGRWVETIVGLAPTSRPTEVERSAAHWSSLAWVVGVLTRRGAIVVAERPAGIRGVALDVLRGAARGVEVTLYASCPEEGDTELPVLYRAVREGEVEERRIADPPRDADGISRIVPAGDLTDPSEVARHIIERLSAIGALAVPVLS
jgi:hypothetical protein